MGEMKRGWRFWTLIALVGVAVAWGAWVLLGPPLVAREPSPNDITHYTLAEIQPTITYLEAHFEKRPDGVLIWPRPGSAVKPDDDLCVTVTILLCKDESSGQSDPPDDRQCGPLNVKMYVDGARVWDLDDSLFGMASGGEHADDVFMAEQRCLRNRPSPGKHLFQIQAYPHGKKVWYSWVWTVEP